MVDLLAFGTQSCLERIHRNRLKMQTKEAADHLEKGNIPPELLTAGASFLLDVIKELISRNGNKKQRITALESQMTIVFERLKLLEERG